MKTSVQTLLAVALALSLAAAVQSQTEEVIEESSPQRPEFGGATEGVYKARITPHWLAGGEDFWYRNDLAGGRREYILVDAAKGERGAAFDHARLAAALADALKSEVAAERLPLEDVEFDRDQQRLLFRAGGKDWRCNLDTYELTAIEDRPRVEGNQGPAPQRPGTRRRSGFGGRPSPVSPDGKWSALVRDFNAYVRSEEDGKEIQLTHDGKEGLAYDLLQWSPDSQTLVAFRVQPGEHKEVYLVESSPRGGGRAKLQARPYDLPGDRFTSYELHLFNIADQKEVPCSVEPIDFGRPRLRWRKGGDAFAYERTDRGHQRFRVIEVNARSGASRNLIDERTTTFIWTAHRENVDLDTVTWLQDSEELIYASERDGWRHLYLIDAEQGTIKNPITQGEFVVRGIDRIDEERRQVWFRASGKEPGQDPYLIHYYRINFDGSQLVALTEGDGNHAIQHAPDGKYFVDTYSRVDLPPVHDLRWTEDGKLVCRLETADVSELEASGWKPPEVFHAKGRDGQTDIWGIICRPRNFDPAKKYPIIEDIYAGPQGSFVPKTFSGRDRYRSLNDLGFIVVKIDGMGTANRSKAFHDVSWHNLKDAGFEDRILWMKAAAAKHPYLDLDRVGVYGTSAGGQNAAGAVLFHPDFYKAAVANCGCHDNRMDKASWNEQWMGYPVGPWYSESSNIDNASRLQGNLLLIVGELDTNVPPESTYRFVDALIKAGKDFDFFVVPGGGHGAGGSYAQRRREDFFVRHLLGSQPPNRNAPSATTVAAAANTARSTTASALDLASLPRSISRIDAVTARYRADRASLSRFYATQASPATLERMRCFYLDWLAKLAAPPADSLTDEDKRELTALNNEVLSAFGQLELDAHRRREIGPLVPFASAIVQLADDRRRLKKMDAVAAAKTVDEIGRQVEALLAGVKKQLESNGSGELDLAADALAQAADLVADLRRQLQRWHGFYNGYARSRRERLGE
ncbi:MAG: prolyl oligopeptidase family serine peptidase [Planctomycetes bacterium]|nr:prolyl oligopeptidase family serine peptidase [Planctomycetota bacterium]